MVVDSRVRCLRILLLICRADNLGREHSIGRREPSSVV